MTIQESYVKLTINEHGKIQPELFISGEPSNDAVAAKLQNLISILESDKYKFKVQKDELHIETKSMSGGWTQITVRGNDYNEVTAKFNDLLNKYPSTK